MVGGKKGKHLGPKLEERTENDITLRRCNKCGQFKPLDDYYKLPRGCCSECRREYQTHYREIYIDKVRAQEERYKASQRGEAKRIRHLIRSRLEKVLPERIASQKTYLYLLLDPRTGKPKYVGITARPKERLWAHAGKTRPRKNDFKWKVELWEEELRSSGLKPIMVIVGKFADRYSAYETEAEFIEGLGNCLLNQVQKSSTKSLASQLRELDSLIGPDS